MTMLSDILRGMSPSSRKMSMDEERDSGRSDQVVRNEYEKAVALGKFTGTLEDFAAAKGMILGPPR